MIHFQPDAARVVVNWDNADLDLKVGKMDANLPGRLECFCSWEYKTSCHPMTLDMDSIDVSMQELGAFRRCRRFSL